jgi:hypothetical protein
MIGLCERLRVHRLTAASAFLKKEKHGFITFRCTYNQAQHRH